MEGNAYPPEPLDIRPPKFDPDAPIVLDQEASKRFHEIVAAGRPTFIEKPLDLDAFYQPLDLGVVADE